MNSHRARICTTSTLQKITAASSTSTVAVVATQTASRRRPTANACV
ncbi:unnamed protein product [Nippostrongylus brasiliensis]|uniref:Uncharacterized protein n=1 Tax=Nippostrongylus brasiliensis TaxID=27835 RepID=A0A0N4XQ95_NIPBR|nr:unnamed protein product [Nippostrongylus brasiliensis]